ncbi:MAG: serine/threonine-protein kinase [Candidatus Aminicenantes bacterium]|jgi:serine/threonine protein kinase/Tfp pilus assembly protein PilF
MSLLGKTIGHIRIVDVLGSGGMGDVYEGLDETLKRKVAVKTIRAKSRLDTQTKVRFLREARVLSQLEHPNICQIYDYIEGDDSDFLVLELIEGQSLQIAQREHLDKSHKLKIAEQIAAVLVVAHEKGVVHRDLKPSNIMLTRNNTVKVLDFGLARFSKAERKTTLHDETTHKDIKKNIEEIAQSKLEEAAEPADLTLSVPGALPDEEPMYKTPEIPGESFKTKRGTVVGTPLYMSPEQARGEAVSASSDMYSFGLLLQQLFTGLEPYDETDEPSTILDKAMKAETRPISGVSSDLATLINRLKSAVPTARPSATETAERLRQIREKPKKRIRNSIISVVVLAFLLLGLKYTMDLRRERRFALQARDEATNVVKFLIDLFEVSDPGEARGNTITAREILSKGANEIEQGLQEQPLTRARLMDTIGTVYIKLGLYEDSEPLLRRALELREELLDDEDIQVAESLASLSLLLEQRGDFDEAEKTATRALQIRERTLPPDHPDIAASLHELAQVYYRQVKLKESEQLQKRALEIRRRVFGSNHPAVAESLSDLGVLYYAQGRYDEAEECYKQALAIREKVLGPDHPEVGRTLNGLASLYLTQKRFDETEPLYERALAIRKKTLGPIHPDVATCLNNIAILFYYKGDFGEAEKYYQQALNIRRQSLAENHPDIAQSLTNLAILYQKMGNLEESKSFYEQSLTVMEKAYGQDNPDVAKSLNNLALLYIDMGNRLQAEKLLNRALRIMEEYFGPENIQVVQSLLYLGFLYQSTERYNKAEQVYSRALIIREKEWGLKHPNLAEILNGLGHVLNKMHQYGRAEKHLLRALDICEKNPGSNPYALADSLHNLGALYFRGLGEKEKAEDYYKRALELEEEVYGKDSREIKETIGDYADLLRELGRADEAKTLESRGQQN